MSLFWWLRLLWAYGQGEIGRYAVCGIIATLLDAAVFGGLYYWQGWHYLLANLVSFSTATLINYFISVTWVFRGYERKHASIESLYFASISLCSLGLNQAVLWLIVWLIGDWSVVIAKISSISVSAIFNFRAKKFILFNLKKPSV